MFGRASLLAKALVQALEMMELFFARGVVRRDVDDYEVEHGDDGEAFVELGEWCQDPCSLVEPDGIEIEEGKHSREEDDPNESADMVI